MRFTYGLDQSLEGQIVLVYLLLEHFTARLLAPKLVLRSSFFATPNFADAVCEIFQTASGFFDCDNSVDAVERITRDSIASNCADTVPTFLNAPRPAAGSLRDWPDTVWLFAAPPKAVGERPTEFRDTVA